MNCLRDLLIFVPDGLNRWRVLRGMVYVKFTGRPICEEKQKDGARIIRRR